MAFRITSLPGAASGSVSVENSSDHISCNALSTLRKTKKKKTLVPYNHAVQDPASLKSQRASTVNPHLAK